MDSPSGLLYLQARYYSPTLNHFQSRDPFSGFARLPVSQNGYNYANGNPVLYADPSGHCVGILAGIDTVTCAVGAVAFVGAFAYAQHQLVNTPFVQQGIEDLSNAVGGFFNTLGEEVAEAVDNCRVLFKGGPQTQPQTQTATTPMPHSRTQQVPLPLPAPRPQPESAGTPEPLIPDLPEKPHITLYHYTSEEGLAGILASQMLLPSLGERGDAQWGDGQYLTDISSSDTRQGTPHQLSRALFTTPWKHNDVQYYIAIDVSGLAIERVSPVFSRTYGDRYIWLHRSREPLPLSGRIEQWGVTPFKVQ